eukprot:768719-Hanusia_phi.AAC.7
MINFELEARGQQDLKTSLRYPSSGSSILHSPERVIIGGVQRAIKGRGKLRWANVGRGGSFDQILHRHLNWTMRCRLLSPPQRSRRLDFEPSALSPASSDECQFLRSPSVAAPPSFCLPSVANLKLLSAILRSREPKIVPWKSSLHDTFLLLLQRAELRDHGRSTEH